jgi:hypothetical protein
LVDITPIRKHPRGPLVAGVVSGSRPA